ncbi:phage tail protein [Jeotgalibacillus terrae]|uniref:Phage tail protein n=1 Tax=Jeotgalibacillus terrae TaxID=587735 RepID=A0ABW5ZH50_9BACL|nr:phage tail protein [Jeotgalibacillus terrae]MBM7580012.1 hypothetical protein [Jeotgalibacillus terrae]
MRPTVSIDQNTLDYAEHMLGDLKKKAPNAISAALNRAMNTVATNISKEIRQEYNIKAGDIKETLSKTRASRTNMNAIVSSRGNLIPLDRFKVTPKNPSPKRKAPIRVGVKKGGKKTLLGAFVADINGNKVFRRQGKKRLPIDRMFGPSVPQMLKNEDIRLRVNQEGQLMFNKRLDHEINRILERSAGQ